MTSQCAARTQGRFLKASWVRTLERVSHRRRPTGCSRERSTGRPTLARWTMVTQARAKTPTPMTVVTRTVVAQTICRTSRKLMASAYGARPPPTPGQGSGAGAGRWCRIRGPVVLVRPDVHNVTGCPPGGTDLSGAFRRCECTGARRPSC